jgi:beta-N-acetylhexosaminidase
MTLKLNHSRISKVKKIKLFSYFQNIIIVLCWLITIILLICAFNLKTPYLFSIRDYLTIGIVLFCLIQGLLTAKHLKLAINLSKSKKLFLTLLIITFVVTIFNEAKFQWHKYYVLHANADNLQQLGKHIIVGYETLDELSLLISKGAVNGVFITRKNIKNKSYLQIKVEIAQMQKISRDNGHTKLMIATDQEGGIVSRFSPPLTKLPSLARVIRDKQIIAARIEAKKYGEIHGKELSTIGINVNLSPVVDLKNNKDNPLDFHSYINKRAISTDATIVSEIALAYSLGLEKYAVIPTLKHFPGMGRVVNDTHHFKSDVDLDRRILEESDWLPFKFILKQSNSFMMLAHVILSNLDSIPVSYSKKIIQAVIRQDWQYKGVLITDDLAMSPIYEGQHGLCGSSIMALNAGVDLLLISYDDEKYYDVMYCLLKAQSENKLDSVMLLDSQLRINKVTKKVWQ